MGDALAVEHPGPLLGNGNAAWLGLAQAHRVPERVALIIDGQTATYAEVTRRVASFASGLVDAGYREGDRIALLMPPSIDFFALAIAAMAKGMAVVMVDGRMGIPRMMASLKASRACAIVSVHKAMRLWPALPPLWRMRRYSADQTAPGVESLDVLRGRGRAIAPIPRQPGDQALISFTSGTSSGAKGSDRTHGVLVGQHLALRDELPDVANGVDMAFFPAVVLHGLALGHKNVLPPIDLRRPGEADPAVVARAMQEHAVTRLFTAPAFAQRLVDHVRTSGIELPRLRAIVIGGAPVSRKLCRAIVELWPRAHAHVAYGSTEAEPIGGVEMGEAARAVGEGLLVGPVAHATEVVLVKSAPPHKLGPMGLAPYLVSPGQAGEVVVRGPHVNQRYVDNPAADRQNKLHAGDGSIWHRTGDVARFDGQGRLWLVSRLGDSFQHGGRTLHPLGVEDSLLEIAGVARVALIAHAGAPAGEIVVELEPGASRSDTLAALRSRLVGLELADLAVVTVAKIPVDLRHQSKIDRGALIRSRTPRRFPGLRSTR